MDVLKFIAEMTASLAWPIAAVGIVLIFKEGILNRLPDLLDLTLPGGISAKFKEKLSVVEQSAAVSPPVVPLGADTLLPTPDTQLPSATAATEPVLETAENALPAETFVDVSNDPDLIALKVNPTGVVMEAWASLEEEIRRYADRVLPPDPFVRLMSISALIKKLVALHRVDEKVAVELNGMHEMRNMAAHAVRAISRTDAERFANVANTLKRKFTLKRALFR